MCRAFLLLFSGSSGFYTFLGEENPPVQLVNEMLLLSLRL